jgi:hypothetical protein
MYFIRRCRFLKCSEEGLLGGGGGGVRSCHFRAQKSLDFQGPPLRNAPRNDVAPLKIITYRAIKTTGTLIVNFQ